MRNEINNYRNHDSRINYRGSDASRIDNLTDAVFGIAITLLLFNQSNPNSFTDLITFTKTLPAFLISISFLVLFWSEHLRFSEIYTLNHSGFTILNTIFIALIIFYVYPLRFLTLFLTSIFFNTEMGLSIQAHQVSYLMIYYGFVAFALYFIIFLFYYNVYRMREKLNLNIFELFYTKSQKNKLIIMFTIPCASILFTTIINQFSLNLAPIIGGITYSLYVPAIIFWHRNYQKKSKEFDYR
jgi:uncharacterized membrane protein